MKNNKKIMIALGASLSMAAPLFAVVACSSSTSMGEKESKFIAFVQSNRGKALLEGMWTEKTIDSIIKDAVANKNKKFTLLGTPTGDEATFKTNILKKLTKNYLIEQTRKDSSFLIKLGNRIKVVDNSTGMKNKLNAWGFNTDYVSDKEWENTPSHYDNDLFELLNCIGENNKKFEKIGFASEIKKLLISKAYLSINKKEWEEVFSIKNENKNDKKDKTHTITLSPIEEKIESSKDFPLTRYALKNKLAYSWSVKLTKEEDTFPFREISELTFDDALKQLSISSGIDGDQISDRAKFSEKHNTFHKKFQTILDAQYRQKFQNLIGYKGLISLPSGTGRLNFSLNSLTATEKQTPSAEKDAMSKDWGFLQKGDIVTKKINLKNPDSIKPNEEPIAINAVMGIIPRPNKDHKLELNPTTQNDENQRVEKYDLDNLSTVFSIKTPSIYSDAIAYFTNRKTNPIKVKVKDDYIKGILEDLGIGYIE